jgi:uncharacterized Zn-binding protein involved in type VI secretion
MPAVARSGDTNIPHCSGHTMSSASGDVFANGRGICRQGDTTSVHLRPAGKKCFPHTASVTSGSGSVFVNGRPVAVIGSGLADCTAIASGSPNVFAG